jgi:transcriptional regulator with XRE-family HTH domain
MAFHPSDIYAGARLRFRRQTLGLSQGAVAEALGLTFQQVQKYERGANRISASRLQALSSFLNVPIGFFFEGEDGSDNPAEKGAGSDMFLEFLTTREGVNFNAAFASITDKSIRRSLLAMVKAIAESTELSNGETQVMGS